MVMSSFTKTILLVLLFIVLVGCEEDVNGIEENENLQANLIELEKTIDEMEHEISLLKTELFSREEKIEELNRKNQSLSEEMESIQYLLSHPDFNVFEEKLFIDEPIVLSPSSMDISKVKELLGEPNKIDEYSEAHGSGIVLVLNYKQASFTFNKDGDNETIKWYTIKSPYFKTNRGITVGSTRNDVVEAYGNTYFIYHEDEKGITIGEKTGISFDLENDVVRELSVWFVYE
jgi:hypothetical protein